MEEYMRVGMGDGKSYMTKRDVYVYLGEKKKKKLYASF